MIFDSLKDLHLFPFYQTIEQAKAAGLSVPAYDPTKLIKSWIDLRPPTADEDGFCNYRGIALAPDGRTPLLRDGKPYLNNLRVPAADVGKLNIPVKGPGTLDQPSREYRMPLRDLQPDEELCLILFGLPSVRKKASAPPTSPDTTPSVSNQAVLDAIATVSAKLDLLIAMK